MAGARKEHELMLDIVEQLPVPAGTEKKIL